MDTAGVSMDLKSALAALDAHEPGTVSAMLGEDHVLAATRPGEEANTAPVDFPAYRRHLAGHAIAIDPLAEVYLAAALPGMFPLRERHRAGLTALQSANIAELLRHDPRRGHPGEDIAAIVRDLPADVQRPEDFFEGWFHQREGSARLQHGCPPPPSPLPQSPSSAGPPTTW
ncbi:hypothetical protein [Kitasatospora sp. P5_F3]